MPIASSLALQTAMRARLLGDAALTALIGGAYVFDAVPPSTREPYVALGDIQTRDWSTKDAKAEEHFATIHVWSREHGRKQTYDIVAAIDEALDGAALSLDGHRLVNLATTFWTVSLDASRKLYHGVVRLRAATEPAA